MNLASHKGDSPIVAYPRTLSLIVASVCGLVDVVLSLASLLLVSQPVGSLVPFVYTSMESTIRVILIHCLGATQHFMIRPMMPMKRGQTLWLNKGKRPLKILHFSMLRRMLKTLEQLPPGLGNSSDVTQPGLDASSLSPAPVNQSGSADSGTSKYFFNRPVSII